MDYYCKIVYLVCLLSVASYVARPLECGTHGDRTHYLNELVCKTSLLIIRSMVGAHLLCEGHVRIERITLTVNVLVF